MRWPVASSPITAEQVRYLADAPERLAEIGLLGSPVVVGALKELLILRETKDRATHLASVERNRRMKAERLCDLAVAELALVRRAWVDAALSTALPGDAFPYPDATG